MRRQRQHKTKIRNPFLRWIIWILLVAGILLYENTEGLIPLSPYDTLQNHDSDSSYDALQNHDSDSSYDALQNHDSDSSYDTGYESNTNYESDSNNAGEPTAGSNSLSELVDLSAIPAYAGTPYTIINNDIPYFTEADMTTEAFEKYSPMDSLGRCHTAYANLCTELMPTEERQPIGAIKPSGWHTIKYDFIDGNYLYNRFHLIGFQLSGENANEENLITGTRYMNIKGILPFENEVASYIRETDHHVLYRVTPLYEGENLVASGVLVEAKSVEDEGAGIQFNVFCYNVQPQVTIDYATGLSH